MVQIASATTTVSFLLSDIQGSTPLWQSHPEEMFVAQAQHDEIVRSVVAASGGELVVAQGEGDSAFAVFDAPEDAIASALRIQIELGGATWPPEVALQVRMGIHSGEARVRDGNYFGPDVNRCARIRSAGHGGQVLLSESTVRSVTELPGGAAVRDLGEHRLKGLAIPERIYQLCHSALRREFPPLTSVDVQRHNLPSPFTSFVGRDAELERLHGLLSEHRLVSVVGAGGSGKTRLAIEAAMRLLGDFGDGAWFVDLAPVADDDRVASAAGGALGLSESHGRPALDAVVDHLCAKRSLLLFDNCEHVLRGAAATAHAVLQRCPGVRILVTSRERLALSGESIFTLAPMPLRSDSEGHPADAIRLFVERAQDADDGFDPSGHEQSIEELCRRLDGLPLALELAACQVPTHTPREILVALAEDFTVLAAPGTPEARQQTLDNLLGWSYKRLDELDARIFRALGVFSGAFTADAAAALLPHDHLDVKDVARALGRLASKSLLVKERQPGMTRYRLLETIKAYALQKAASCGEIAAVRRLHLQFFRDLAVEAAPRLQEPNQITWLDVLEGQREDSLAAIAWAVESGDGGRAVELAAALAWFWEIRGYFDEGRESLEKALGAGAGSDAARSHAQVGAGRMAAARGDPAGAKAHFVAAVSAAERSGDDYTIAWALHNLAPCVSRTEAYDFLERGLAAARRSQVPWVVLPLLHNRGVFAQEEGDTEGARARWEEGLEIARLHGVKVAEVTMLNSLAQLAHEEGRIDAARSFAEEAHSIAEAMRHRRGLVEALTNLARVDRIDRRLNHAGARLDEALELAREAAIETSILAVETHLENGRVQQELGREREAATAFETAAAIAREAGEAAALCDALYELGRVAHLRGDRSEARGSLEESIELARRLRNEAKEQRSREELLELSRGGQPAV